MTLDRLAAAWPFAVAVPDSYRQACTLLGIDRPEVVLSAGYTLSVPLLVAGTVLSGPIGRPVIGVATVLSGALGLASARFGVELAARARRVRALGTAPALVTALALGVELWPTTERATAFATDSGDGLLTDSLRTARRRARGTPGSGLDAFTDQWADSFPALDRAVADIQRAAAAPAEERAPILARARRQILDGTHEELSTYAVSLRVPATAVYAFGVLLPLALVSLVPAAGMAGVPVTRAALVIAYVFVLPTGLVVACVWLLARRPVAFPPEPVPRTHPDVPDSPWPAVALGVAVGVATWVLAPALVASWGVPIATLGLAVGTALVASYRPVVAVRDRVANVEAGLPDALTELGRRLSRGQALEAALPEVPEESPEPIATVFERAAARQRRLGTDIEGAFRGPLSTLPSRRLRDAVSLLSAAATVGRPAGEAITKMGDHLSELRALERETRRDLAQITGTLSNTAALFGPLIGGATVALAGSIGGAGPMTAVPVTTLGPVVGWYVLVLAALLTTLSVGLRRGLDRALVGYRVGLALLAATAAYFAAVAGTGLLV